MFGAMDALCCFGCCTFSRRPHWNCCGIIVHDCGNRSATYAIFIQNCFTWLIKIYSSEPNAVANLTAQQTSYDITVYFSPPNVLVGQIVYYIVECWSSNSLVYNVTVREPAYNPRALFQHQMYDAALGPSHKVDIPANVLNQTL